MTIEGLDKAPALRVNHNVSWVELRKRVDRDEDPVDAVLCAYVGLYWYRRPEDVTIYGDYGGGYIVTPTLPSGAAPARRRRPAPRTDVEDLRARVAQVAALLDEAQRGLSAIRRQLEGS